MTVTNLVTTVSKDSVRQLPGAHAPRGTNAKNRTRSSARSRENWSKLLNKSASIDIIRVTRRDREGGEQTALIKQRVSLRGECVWSVNSTVTTHLDYFVRKDTSQSVTRCCDDTSWQDARKFLCTKSPLVLREVRNRRIAKFPWECFLKCATNVTFLKNWLAPQKNKTALHAVLWNRASHGYN